jgi:hypothetical protein
MSAHSWELKKKHLLPYTHGLELILTTNFARSSVDRKIRHAKLNALINMYKTFQMSATTPIRHHRFKMRAVILLCYQFLSSLSYVLLLEEL